MRMTRPVTLEMESDKEPPEAMLVVDTYCKTCFAVVPGHRLRDHIQAVHSQAKASDK